MLLVSGRGQGRVGSCKLHLSAACLGPPGQIGCSKLWRTPSGYAGCGSRSGADVLSGVEKLASHASKFTESIGHISGRITTESIGAYADMATHIGGRAGATTRAAFWLPEST
jgi:hypothetical protein